MLSIQIDDQSGVALFEVSGPLTESDFKSAAKAINPWIEKHGKLNGLIIHTKSFPGWESFAALCSHLTFVKEHHKKIDRVALITDSVLGGVAEKIAGHFVNAEIQSFPYKSFDIAKSWVSLNRQVTPDRAGSCLANVKQRSLRANP